MGLGASTGTCNRPCMGAGRSSSAWQSDMGKASPSATCWSCAKGVSCRGYANKLSWGGLVMALKAPAHNGVGETRPLGHPSPCAAPTYDERQSGIGWQGSQTRAQPQAGAGHGSFCVLNEADDRPGCDGIKCPVEDPSHVLMQHMGSLVLGGAAGWVTGTHLQKRLLAYPAA